MRFILMAAAVGCLAACNPGGEKTGAGPEQPGESRNSESFNEGVQSFLQTYYSLTEAFVNWDTTDVNSKAFLLHKKLSNLPLGEFQKDSDLVKSASDALRLSRAQAARIQSETEIVKKREALNALTQDLFDFLRIVKYDRRKIYLQECAMAFNDEDPGIWLSEKNTIRNPYLGLHHPNYGRGMVDCGENLAVIDFPSSADSTKTK